ncbi:MAG: 50S ribosome-binding GTPase [Thermoguttaceae bacterium]|nr:50S ribosome-binding GTPase [Thermoguttaceae bacterium]
MLALKNLHDKIEQLCSLMPQLEEYAQLVQAESSQDAPWRDSLLSKLRVQSSEETPLIVAIAGGTNIGKSTVFNHLAQDNASGITPCASGTKYPVCLVPAQWADEEKLQKLFDGFVVKPWSDSAAPLEEHEEDVLYWRQGVNVPPQLILLDTPDVDSTNKANWRRAEKIRQIADVLIAVLTKQKYNDAVCVDFFRQATKSGKKFILLFNQFDMEDVSYLQDMVNKIVSNIEQPPIFIYLAPHDRKASESLGLPFYYVPVSSDGTVKSDQIDLNAPKSLTDELAKMHFEELKAYSLVKSLADSMDSNTGLGKWLSDIRVQSEQYALRLKALEELNPGTIEVPILPNEMIRKELQLWRSSFRGSWTNWAMAPTEALGKVWKYAVSFFKKNDENEPTAEEKFLELERTYMFNAVEKIHNSLKNQAAFDNVLGNELRAILASNSIESILQRVESEHKSAPILSEGFHDYVKSELTQWSEKHPWKSNIYKALDSALVIARPAATVALGTCFWFTPTVTLGAVTAVAGASNAFDLMSLGDLGCKIQNRFCIERAQWLQSIIRQELHLDELFEKMKRQSSVTDEDAYKQAATLQQELESFASICN